MLARFRAAVRASIDDADRLVDKGSADLFTQVSRSTDKWLWMDDSHTTRER